MSPDPYAAKGWPREVASEMRSPRDTWLMRLEQLGATPDELAQVLAEWPDPEYQAAVHDMLLLGDNELRAALLEVRSEYEVGTTTEAEAAADDEHARYRAAEAEATGRMGGTVPAVMAWVGSDLIRAQVVHHLETAAGGANRATLVRPLQDLLDT